MKENNIVSFSGGKDSTAMLIMMIERGIHIDDIIFCDTGMEFPGMYKHIDKVEKYIGRKITRVRSEKTYEYYLGEHKKRNGCIGYGHPDFFNRWCTQVLKKTPYARYIKKYIDIVEYHGIAFDEKERADRNRENGRVIKYPLVEWEVTEPQALQYCYDRGFDWEGLYEDFNRVSCWCCPLSQINELRMLYNKYPDLWSELKRIDKKSFRRFRFDYSVDDLEKKFIAESRQGVFEF